MLLTRETSTDEVVYPSEFKRYLSNRAAVPGLSPLDDPETLVLVVTERPSDPTELVSVLDSDDVPETADDMRIRACYLPEQVEAAFAGGATHVEAIGGALEEYMETDGAAGRCHFWLTI